MEPEQLPQSGIDFFLTFKKTLSKIYNLAFASGFCAVWVLAGAECCSVGEEGVPARPPAGTGAPRDAAGVGPGQHASTLNRLLSPAANCRLPQKRDQALN